MGKVAISSLGSFEAEFGVVGLNVGPRIGPNKRSHDDKEWYVVRRFLKPALHHGLFSLPINVQKARPPAPDFVLKRDDCVVVAYIEITEATARGDQQEMTKVAQCNGWVSAGTFGGRYSAPALGSRPERDWVADVIRAIRRKRKKAIVMSCEIERHLVIYPNSSASSLVDEALALRRLLDFIGDWKTSLLEVTAGCAMYLLGKQYVCFDLLGTRPLLVCKD